MEVIFAEKVTITLKLNEEEAIWLRDYMQNGFAAAETRDRKMREKFFEALTPSPERPHLAERVHNRLVKEEMED